MPQLQVAIEEPSISSYARLADARPTGIGGRRGGLAPVDIDRPGANYGGIYRQWVERTLGTSCTCLLGKSQTFPAASELAIGAGLNDVRMLNHVQPRPDADHRFPDRCQPVVVIGGIRPSFCWFPGVRFRWR
jgi:hypothetical protein